MNVMSVNKRGRPPDDSARQTTQETPSERAERGNLLRGACRVIGKRGYKAASISRIAEESKISVGHCYKYFPSRAVILDNVILWIMEEFERYADARLAKTSGYLEFENSVIDLYFSFQKKNQYFLKILKNSEIETPETWQIFSDRRARRYLDRLELALAEGEIKGYARGELPELNTYLSVLRKTIVFRYADNKTDLPAAIKTYNRFVEQALRLGG